MLRDFLIQKLDMVFQSFFLLGQTFMELRIIAVGLFNIFFIVDSQLLLVGCLQLGY